MFTLSLIALGNASFPIKERKNISWVEISLISKIKNCEKAEVSKCKFGGFPVNANAWLINQHMLEKLNKNFNGLQQKQKILHFAPTSPTRSTRSGLVKRGMFVAESGPRNGGYGGFTGCTCRCGTPPRLLPCAAGGTGNSCGLYWPPTGTGVTHYRARRETETVAVWVKSAGKVNCFCKHHRKCSLLCSDSWPGSCCVCDTGLC